MDEALYNGILAALEAVHAPQTPSEARHAAGQMLEGFKERPDGLPYGLYILQTPSPRHTDEVRHFALHLLEHILRVRWLPQKDPPNQLGGATGQGQKHDTRRPPESAPGQPPQLTLAEKEQLKEAMLQVMARGTRDVAQEAQFVKIKVADLVAQLAERDYPQRWEGFLDQMMQAWTTGPTQAELAMMVLARLVEDCHDADFRSEIDFSRRDPILRGIHEFLPQLMPTLYNFLVQEWTDYQKAVAAARASTGAGVVEAALLNRALNLLSKILPWVGEKWMGAEAHDFLPAIAQLSTLRVARSEALTCLEAMCSRKLTEAHFLRMMEHLPDMVLTVKQAIAQEAVPLSESLEVHQMLSACLEEALMRNINFIAGDKELRDRSSRRSELLSKFLEQLLQLTQMPSKRMAGNLIQAWQAFANKPNAKDTPAFVVLVPQLLAAFAAHSVAVRFEDDVTDDPVAAEEFVDEAEYLHFMRTFRMQVKALQIQLSKMNPLHTVRYILEQAQTLLQNHSSGRDHLDAKGLPTWKTEACGSWSTFAALVRGAVAGLPDWCIGGQPDDPDEILEGGKAGYVSSECFDMLRTLTDAIMKWQPNGSILIDLQLAVLEACRPILVHEPGMLQSIFDKVFTLLEAPDPSVNAAAMAGATVVMVSPEVESVRQAASRALVVLATDVSDVLVVALEGICRRVAEILNKNKPSLAVRTHLLELLVVVSNSVKDDNKRKAFVLDMLKDPMSVWVGEEVTSAVSSPDQLLARLGITPDLPQDDAAYAPGAPRTAQAGVAFQTIRAPLTVLHGLGMRVSVGDDKSFHGDLDKMLRGGLEGLSAVNPFAVAWSQALPNIVNLMRSVHMLWAPPTRERLLTHPVARYTLAMIPSDESEANRRKNKSGDYELTPDELKSKTLVEQWCRMLHDLRTVCYNLIGLACKQGALYLTIPATKVRDVIIGGIFAGFEYIENRHMGGFCSRFVEKFVVFCPPSLVRSHVAPVMELIARNMMPRLSASWSPGSAGAQTLRTSNLELFQVYGEGGVMLSPENLDNDELEELKVKQRAMMTRALAQLVHTALGIRGELVTSNSPADKDRISSNGSGAGNARNRGRASNKGRSNNKQGDKLTESKKIRRRTLLDVLVRGNQAVASSLVMFTVGLIKHWGDVTASRKALGIAALIVEEYDQRSDLMRQRLSRDLFSGLVDALVEGAPHLEGMEWDTVVLAKTLYKLFAIGVSNDRRGKDDSLRKKLLSLPGVFESDVNALEKELRNSGSDSRAQKEAMRDVLRRATVVASAAAGASGGQGQARSFWRDNRGRSGGGKGQSNNKHSRRRNQNRNGADHADADADNPSSDILWQRFPRQR